MVTQAENRRSHARARDLIQPREWPYLFTGEMVRALLDDRKTQTRRILTARNSFVNGWPPCMRADPAIIEAWPNLDFGDVFVDRGPSPAGNPGPYLQVRGGDHSRQRVYPRVQVGHQLWVKETHTAAPDFDEEVGSPFVVYRADLTPEQEREERSVRRLGPNLAAAYRWTPSIFMPRWASRITLEVTAVRPERIQDLSEEDARAEGVRPLQMDLGSYVPRFQGLWDSINGKREGCAWSDNPWVWAITFRRLQP